MGDGYNEGYDEEDGENLHHAPLAATGKQIFFEQISGGGARGGGNSRKKTKRPVGRSRKSSSRSNIMSNYSNIIRYFKVRKRRVRAEGLRA